MTHLLSRLKHQNENIDYSLLIMGRTKIKKIEHFKIVIIIAFILFLLFSNYSIISYAEENTIVSENSLSVLKVSSSKELNTEKENEVIVSTFNGMKVAFIVIGVLVIAIPIIIIILIVKWLIRKKKHIKNTDFE
jgi:amino acid transporter